MAVKSGVPTTVNGVQVGATDFREFAIGAGLPAGITKYNVSTGTPTAVGIFDAPLTPTFGDEGKYFEMSGLAILGNEVWAFGLDAFDGIMEQGELLARIYFNVGGTQNRTCIGPAMSLQDNPNVSGAGSVVRDEFASGEVEVGGGVFINGGVTNVGTFAIQEPIQDPEWMWMRIRKTNNDAAPSEDDWQVTAWYGDIEDEPSSPDGIDPAPQNFTAPRGLFAIGWGLIPSASIFTQRIAFLSYSLDPDVEPPPKEVGVATIWTPFPAEGRSGAVGTLNGAIIGASDFSEFPVAIGLPAGITEFGITPSSPPFVAIEVDPVEGNYFQMALQGFQSWGFGLDSFFGQMLTGELLARVWMDIPVNGRKTLGPAANMEGLIGQSQPGADFDCWSGAFFRLDPDELSGAFTTNDGSASNTLTAPLQEVLQDEAWAWIRVRRLLNDVDPLTEDDWTITAWFGALEDEPVSPDGTNIGQPRSVAFVQEAIGWMMPGNAGAETEQRIAFLSFTSDPLLAAPPTELLGTTWLDIPATPPGTVWANLS